MRIPFPERIPIANLAVFATVLLLIQRAEGTPAYFCAGCFVFILIAGLAFNTAGGLSRASGAYVFFYSTLVVIIGLCYKAFLGEPAQSNLLDPRTDIKVYVGGITSMFAAVVISRRLSRKTSLLPGLLKDSEMYRAAIGCIVFGIFGAIAIARLGESAIGIQTAFGQLNRLIPIGILIGVTYEIRRSGGTRSVNLPVLLGGAFFCANGLFNFSKEGIITPFACWLVPVCVMRYRLSAMQIGSCLLATFIMFYYVTPFAQYGRSFNQPGTTSKQKINTAIKLLEDPEGTRRTYLQMQEEAPVGALGQYFNTPQGFWDRLQFISIDDAVINYTDQGHVFGLLPLVQAFYNTVPHFLWPNKPNVNYNYLLMLEIGGQPSDSDDPGYGISLSPTSDAYHQAGWIGIFLVAPLLWTLFFTVFDSLLGDIRTTPWGMMALILISHDAPEGSLEGMIYLLSYGVEILVFCALFAKWAAPFFATVVLGPQRSLAAAHHLTPAASARTQRPTS